MSTGRDEAEVLEAKRDARVGRAEWLAMIALARGHTIEHLQRRNERFKREATAAVEQLTFRSTVRETELLELRGQVERLTNEARCAHEAAESERDAAAEERALRHQAETERDEARRDRYEAQRTTSTLADELARTKKALHDRRDEVGKLQSRVSTLTDKLARAEKDRDEAREGADALAEDARSAITERDSAIEDARQLQARLARIEPELERMRESRLCHDCALRETVRCIYSDGKEHPCWLWTLKRD